MGLLSVEEMHMKRMPVLCQQRTVSAEKMKCNCEFVGILVACEAIQIC